MRRRGFTLTELLLALALAGILAGTAGQVLLATHRLAQRQVQQIDLNANLHSAIAILPAELRELDASDPAGSDLIRMTDSSLTYKAMRNLYTTCLPASGNTVQLDTAFWGLRPLDEQYDSLLMLAGPAGPADRDRWIRVDLKKLRPGQGCPGGRPSLAASVNPAVAVDESIPAGSPVRGFEIAEVGRYRDAAGSTWLGARRHQKVGGWGALQPLAGPLVIGGLRLDYFASDGFAARDPGRIARIGVTVIARSALRGSWKTGYLVDSLSTQVALRNNR